MRATWRPSIRTVRVTPPPPGSRPRVTSGNPISVWLSSTAIRWWHARAISKPPPRAAPLMAATTGLPSLSRRRSWDLIASTSANTSAASSAVTWLSRLRSPPAKKVFFALAMTTPVMWSFSASSRSIATPMDAV